MGEIASVANLIIKIGDILAKQREHLDSAVKNFDDVKDELMNIHAFLIKADTDDLTDIQFKNWVTQVRNVSYDAEDVLDEYELNIIAAPCVCSCYHHCGAFHKVGSLCTQYTIATKMQDIVNKFGEVRASYNRYNISSIEPSTTVVQHHTRDDVDLQDSDYFVGLDTKTAELIGLIAGLDDPSLIIFPIHGMTGIGKTSLARMVYADPIFKAKFDCHGWITLPDKVGKMENHLIDLYKQLYKGRVKTEHVNVEKLESMSLADLKLEVSEFLKKSHYLIVLDNVWNYETWRSIQNVFPRNQNCSRIIITTSNSSIMKTVRTSDKHQYSLEPLDKTESLSLLVKRACNGGRCPPHLADTAKSISDKCGGLPLVIEAIGGVLATMDTEAGTNEWDKELRSFCTIVNDDEKFRSTYDILFKCYYRLKYWLKPCYLYTVIFRENHPIVSKNLIRLWIAEGFVEKQDGLTQEETAERYLSDLRKSYLIQVEDMSTDGKIKTFSVHGQLRKILLSKTKDNNFAGIAKAEGGSWPDIIRRLSIHDMLPKIEKTRTLDKLRSLIISGVSESLLKSSMPNLFSGQYKFLTVLDLQDITDLVEFPYFITKMFNLKYLSLRNTAVEAIPSSIGKLTKLETLDLKHTPVSKLPNKILKLKLLRELLVYHHKPEKYPASHSKCGVKAPNGLSCLTNLEKLCFLKAGNDGELLIREVGELTELRRLGIIDLNTASQKELCSSIDKLHKLRALSLTSFESEELDLRQVTRPPDTLCRLYLTGRLESLPPWIRSLTKLFKLILKSSALTINPLPVLEKLPVLVHVEFLQAYNGAELQFKAGTFQKLKILGIRKLEHLKSISVEENAMPGLERLVLEKCDQLTRLPSGIRNLSNLKQVNLINMSEALQNSLQKSETEANDYKNIEHIKEVNWIFKEGNGDDTWRTQNLKM